MQCKLQLVLPGFVWWIQRSWMPGRNSEWKSCCWRVSSFHWVGLLCSWLVAIFCYHFKWLNEHIYSAIKDFASNWTFFFCKSPGDFDLEACYPWQVSLAMHWRSGLGILWWKQWRLLRSLGYAAGHGQLESCLWNLGSIERPKLSKAQKMQCCNMSCWTI